MIVRRTHHRRDPGLIELFDTVHLLDRRDKKPKGLWWGSYGKDRAPYGWIEWLKESRLDEYRHGWRVMLLPEFRLLTLQSFEDIMWFGEEYKGEQPPGLKCLYAIDWPRVAESFDGIEIAPYCWSARMHHRAIWYYGWDCESGCAWRVNAIQIEPLPMTECCSCRQVKEFWCFPRKPDTATGRESICKMCRAKLPRPRASTLPSYQTRLVRERERYAANIEAERARKRNDYRRRQNARKSKTAQDAG